MSFRSPVLFLAVVVVVSGLGCATGDEPKNTPAPNTASSNGAPYAAATPGKNFTTTDVAKLRWIEGAWRGMDGENPFYERYKVEENAMIVESLKEDGSLDGEPGRFELTNGEFGKGEGDRRSAASEITDTFVQFVPVVAGKGNNFRFVKQPHGWDAILEWPATADKPASRKVYKMEPWQPTK